MVISILGTDYTIIEKTYSEDPSFYAKGLCGYCDYRKHLIVICDPKSYPGWDPKETKSIKEERNVTLRHEIFHAFLSESGLNEAALPSPGAWSKNEEMIDWFAIQSPKIFKAYKDAKCI